MRTGEPGHGHPGGDRAIASSGGTVADRFPQGPDFVLHRLEDLQAETFPAHALADRRQEQKGRQSSGAPTVRSRSLVVCRSDLTRPARGARRKSGAPPLKHRTIPADS